MPNINKQIYNKINSGLLILLGIDKKDESSDIKYLIDKITHHK